MFPPEFVKLHVTIMVSATANPLIAVVPYMVSAVVVVEPAPAPIKLVAPPPAAFHAPSPRRNVALLAVPLPNRAVATVPDDNALAFSVVRLVPLRSSMIVVLNGPLIFPSVPTSATFPVPAVIPPATSMLVADVSVVASLPDVKRSVLSL